MSSVRQKMQAVNKQQLKKEEEISNGNGTIINEDADRKIDIEAIAKKADKDAAKLLKETTIKLKKAKPKAKPKAKVKSEPKAKAVVKKKSKPAGTKNKK